MRYPGIERGHHLPAARRLGHHVQKYGRRQRQTQHHKGSCRSSWVKRSSAARYSPERCGPRPIEVAKQRSQGRSGLPVSAERGERAPRVTDHRAERRRNSPGPAHARKR